MLCDKVTWPPETKNLIEDINHVCKTGRQKEASLWSRDKALVGIKRREKLFLPWNVGSLHRFTDSELGI